MSNLDSFHPFRQTINVKDESPKNSNPDNNSQSDSKDKEDIQFTPWLSWKTKFRFLIATLGLIAIFLIGNSVYSTLSPLLSPFGDHSPKQSLESINENQGIPLAFDKNDLDERGREVGHARQKAGFLASIFCKGGKKSRFCD